MRSLHAFLRCVLWLILYSALTSCGGGGGGSNALPAPTITSVSVSCNPTSVETGQTSQCAATVSGTGSYSSAVTWGASAGTINSSGLLTAPSSAGSVTVTATSTQDTTKSGTATVTVTVPVTITSVSVSCNPTALQLGGTSQCTATVTGTGNFSSAVTWSVSAGTINSSGLLTASGIEGPFEGNEVDIFVYATSAQDTSKRGDTGVDVLLPEAQLYPTSRAASLAFGNQSVDTTSTAQAVTLVNLGPGVLTISSIAASANFGQINNCGSSLGAATGLGTSGECTINVTFSPTATGPLTGTLVVTDNSNGMAGSTQTVSLSGTGIVPVAITGVSITPTSATLGSGTTQQFSATVSGTGNYNTSVSWYVCNGNGANCANGGNSSYGTVSTTGLYTTPVIQVGGQGLTVTVEAVANGNSSELANATVIVTVPAFSNASLNGQYAFSLRDPTYTVFVGGSFVADGNGDLTQGVLDFISVPDAASAFYSGNSGGTGTNVAFSGSYQVGVDGRGTLTLVSSLPPNELPSSYDFVMVSTAEGRMVSTNVVYASGALFKQDTSAFSNAAVAGNYAFRNVGRYSSPDCPLDASGVFTLDGQGNVLAGTKDYNTCSEGPYNTTFAGTYSIGPNGRGTLAYKDPFDSYALYVYVISASRMLLVSLGPPVACTTNCAPLVSTGEADVQSGLPFSNASVSGGYTFALSGFAGTWELLAGQFTADGQNGTTEGEQDTVDDSLASTSDVPEQGTFEVTSNGRGTTDGFPSIVFYFVSPSQAFLISSNYEVGKAYGQASGPFTIAGNYAFSFAGLSEPTTGETITASGQFTADGAGTIQSGTIDFGYLGAANQLAGTYSNIDSTGRGTMSINAEVGGSQVTFNFAFYVTSSSEITLIGVNDDVLGGAMQQ